MSTSFPWHSNLIQNGGSYTLLRLLEMPIVIFKFWVTFTSHTHKLAIAAHNNKRVFAGTKIKCFTCYQTILYNANVQKSGCHLNPYWIWLAVLFTAENVQIFVWSSSPYPPLVKWWADNECYVNPMPHELVWKKTWSTKSLFLVVYLSVFTRSLSWAMRVWAWLSSSLALWRLSSFAVVSFLICDSSFWIDFIFAAFKLSSSSRADTCCCIADTDTGEQTIHKETVN